MLVALVVVGLLLIGFIGVFLIDKLGISIEFWRFRDDTTNCWIFDEYRNHLDHYNGKIETAYEGVERIRWRSARHKQNQIFVYHDERDKRPRWRGRWVYQVKAGELVPVPYMLAHNNPQRITDNDLRAWEKANFAQRFADAIAGGFGLKEILLIICIVAIGIVGVFVWQQGQTTGKRFQALDQQLQAQNDTLNKLEKYLTPPDLEIQP